MLSNVLRVLLMKVTTRHMEKRSRKYQKLHEDELGAYYCARPMMAKEIAGNARAFLPILFAFALVVVIATIWLIYEQIKEGKIDILISTTVIEVGVDVPNSNIMVIENAERFGLAQLHQLRGRVGRGEYKSYCILKYQGNSELIRKRMQVMQETNDGFIISEKDLELRGSGEFFGTKQHGIPEFKVANLFEDMKLLKLVQSAAIKILEEDPGLEEQKNIRLKNIIDKKLSTRIEI